ncbi:MAG: T9SS-dependent M36 family metallopeptidase [Crocinitomicaceae bacterium]|nr:T9SS-dependent M36 family metallopeptidase [Crocinitomicaceae bacterium]
MISLRKSLHAPIALLFSAISFFSFSQDAEKQIQNYLDENKDVLGLTELDVQNWRITNQHESKQVGLKHVYISQEYNGIEIFGANAVFAIKGEKVLMTGNRLEIDISSKVISPSASLSNEEAIYAAATRLDLEAPLTINRLEDKNAETAIFSAPSLSLESIPVRSVYMVEENQLTLAWNLNIYELSTDHWWNVIVDANDGRIITKVDWVVSCNFDHQHSTENCATTTKQETASIPTFLMPPPPPPATDEYNVFALPVESPNHGSRTLVVGPSDPLASPFGWHDDDGVPGEEYTITRGNNVHAMEDLNDNNGVGYSPDGGAGLSFDFPADLNLTSNTYLDAAIANLFYMNNMMHDVWYRYGFDETSGNFQENNYGNGGQGSDYVNADAQDGGGTNNANFATPNDGQNPRMQMYLWSPSGSSDLVTVNSPASVAGSYGGVEAGFGPALPSTPITEDLVLPIDPTPDVYDACEDPVTPGLMNGKIALIMRGSCPFVDKVQRAQDDGAVAVIVVNNQTTAPFAMGGTSTTITIPSVMISNADGLALINAIEGGATINATLANGGVFALDGDFDNGIVAHEYGHGISNRLTGGANNSSCLGNAEQMGEGWSDWFATVMTIEPGDQANDVRGIGTFASGDPVTGQGIRPAPYSRDPNVNDFTYAATNNNGISQPHGIGFVWATMLWDMTWDLIDQYGWDPDLAAGTGGNNIAMQLVTTGLKLQACSPGFIDGRDAILDADQLLYNGANQCLIWEAFANRGLGFSADQGSSDDRFDQVEAFDLPPNLATTTTITTCGEYVWAVDGQTYTTSGTYTAPLTGNVCSNTAILELTITPGITNLNVVPIGTTLTASQSNLNYQWIDCETNQAIPGETNQSFAPTTTGQYAVILSLGSCIDTTDCKTVNIVGLNENEFSNSLVVYPNPTEGTLYVEFNKEHTGIETRLLDMSGRVVLSKGFEATEEVELFFEGQSGVYFLEIESTDGQKAVVKVQKF